MWIRRLAALLAAIALVGGAMVVRDRIDRSPAAASGPTSTSATGGGGSATTQPTTFTLVCITELEKACQAAASEVKGPPAIAVRVEEAGTTRDALTTAADPGSVVSAWVTLSPWAKLTDLARGRAPSPLLPAFDAALPLAQSPIAMAVKADRYDALDKTCSPTITWTCIGNNAGKPWTDLNGNVSWGTLNPAHADPAVNATGLVALAAIVESKIGNSTFTGADLDKDDDFSAWINRFEQAIRASAFNPDSSPLQQLLRQPDHSVIATTHAEIVSLSGTNRAVVREVTPVQTATAEAIVAPVLGVVLPPAIVTALSNALLDIGWTAPTSGATNAPDATTMEAIQAKWSTSWRR